MSTLVFSFKEENNKINFSKKYIKTGVSGIGSFPLKSLFWDNIYPTPSITSN